MNQVQEIELQIEAAREIIAKRDALHRLTDNEDFKTVVREGYLKEEAIRLVQLKAQPQVQKPEIQADIVKAIDGIGCFLKYLQTIEFMAEQAERAIEEANEELAEIRSGEEVEV